MSTDDSGTAETELVDLLERLGFRQYEAQTLISLSRLGTGTAKDIARVSDVPRTRVYDAVDALHERGLVDVQYTTPKKFTIVSRETLVRKLNVERERTIDEISDLLEELGPEETTQEQFGVWTVTGKTAVAERVTGFLEDADEKVVLMTTDDLLTDEQLDALAAAHERGVEIYLAGISETVQQRIQSEVPSAELFETLWEWGETPAGTLLIVDDRSALVSALVDDGADSHEETAIWGSGQRNSLVVVLRTIFTWRLGEHEADESVLESEQDGAGESED
ncbi:TrmB family transcriptional regulator [Haloparvum sp. PAK95]|uniref:TrmB family transcriptional regulator n=1 Tax=Haloparvum sp. PAK95 TaxID=3418962 RepID=UPI003D2EF83A